MRKDEVKKQTMICQFKIIGYHIPIHGESATKINWIQEKNSKVKILEY